MRSPNFPACHPSVAVWVLAGGKSSRMGRDKALLEWHGVTLLTRVCQVAQTVSLEVQVLSPWPDRYVSLLPDGVEPIRESEAGRGPLWALKQGLTQTQAQWLLLLACDMPFVSGECLQQWRSHLSHLPGTCLAYVPQTPHGQMFRWEPLCGFYRQSSLEALAQFLDQGGRSFQQWLDQIEVAPISLIGDDAQMLFNCNTPDDWSVIENLNTPSPFPRETS